MSPLRAGLTDASSALRDRLPRGRTAEVAILLGLLALATLLRLPDLGTRGPWDTDQGEQMLAIREIANGRLTLLGPPTSTGGLHHGTVFYYLGALFALPSAGGDPTAVTFGIALGGIATVGFTWWLAWAAAGPRNGLVAGVVAGLLTAVSAQMVDASVRLWNPAFVAPAASFALAAAMESRRRDDPRWWLAAGIGLVLAGQSHVLAWILIVPLAVLALGELQRSGRRALPWLAAAAGLVALSFVPVAISELQTGFGEIQALIAARGGTTEEAPALWVRAVFVPLRILGIPLLGDIGRSLALLPVAVALVIGAAAIAIRSRPAAPGMGAAEPWGASNLQEPGPGPTAPATSAGSAVPATSAGSAALLAIGLALGALGLAAGAPWLATVTPLYVDHYHLAVDPLVFALLGLGAAALWRRRPGRALVVVAVAVVAAWNLGFVALPGVNPDGGWPAGLDAGRRVLDATGGQRAAVTGVPVFKKTAAVTYPMTILGAPPVEPAAARRVVVLCDRLFEEVVEVACLGPAEERRLAAIGVEPGRLIDRFEAAPGRWISVYEVAGR